MDKKIVLTVRTLRKSATHGVLQAGPVTVPCALGQGGAGWRKREGDRKTPIGDWHVQVVFWRSDRVRRWSLVPCGLAGRDLAPDDGWCDAPADRNYNRYVRLPYDARAEALWRDDRLYDVLIVLSHNHRPRIRGLGSAIFLHIAKVDEATGGLQPTAGCVAVRKRDLARIRHVIRQGTIVRVAG